MKHTFSAIPTNIYINHNCWAGGVMLIRELLAVAGTLNAREPDLHAAAMFDVALVGPTMQPVRSFTGPALLPERSLRNARQADVLVLPSFYGDVPASPALIRWIIKHYEAGGCILASASGVRLRGKPNFSRRWKLGACGSKRRKRRAPSVRRTA